MRAHSVAVVLSAVLLGIAGVIYMFPFSDGPYTDGVLLVITSVVVMFLLFIRIKFFE